MKAIIISIGDELLLGRTVDTNSAWLSQQLAGLGATILAHVTVGDDQAETRDAIDQAARRADWVLVSGGLGPTPDDLTREALAEALGAPLELREEFVEQIAGFFRRFGKEMPERNKVQAMFPIGSTAIENTCGTAPGVQARLHDAEVFVMPGVPREMKIMFERDAVPQLSARSGGKVILTETLWTFGQGESTVAARIADLMERGRNPAVGTTAYDAKIGVRIFSGGNTRAEAERLLEATADEIRARLGALVYGRGEETLADAVGVLLRERGQTVATAESCTGGLIAKTLTDVSGSSAYFLSGVVTYSNAAKTALLGVPADLIAEHGAVSSEVAEAMVIGCRGRAGADWALATTGIAGPTGGTAEKPVGLVYVGLDGPDGCQVREYRLGEHLGRDDVRSRSRWAALSLLRLCLLGEKIDSTWSRVPRPCGGTG
ncbi:MAG: competence/damage-inducible protein A [Phycisphaerae bacterium]|nr:competence/damage-inducible protein A [Phycisphaerae bacterium]